MTPLPANTHPSHDWHPNDDITSCVLCGCRTYNDEAKQPCKGASVACKHGALVQHLTVDMFGLGNTGWCKGAVKVKRGAS